jgi:hypothetical protein
MKKTAIVLCMVSLHAFAQKEETKRDTTRMNMGNVEIILIDHSDENVGKLDTIDAAPGDSKEDKAFEAHWAGLDMGFMVLMNDQFNQDFGTSDYLKNDIGRSMVWNLNVFEHKFPIAKEYLGITTGLGFSFTQVAFRNNYVATVEFNNEGGGDLVAYQDTLINYTKNKLKATYLTVPLLLEFNSNADADKSFYVAAGVVGGVKIASRYKRAYDDGKSVVSVQKGQFGLQTFRLDGTVRIGYGDWGAFASYGLLPLFYTTNNPQANPLIFGLTLNF